MTRIEDGPENSPPEELFALSVKQPWAALLVAGVKTVEVRTWPTARRGRVLIHAGKIPDDRPEGWAQNHAEALKQLVTGDLRLAPAQDYRCAVPLASVLSPTQQLQRVEDAEGRARAAFAPLNGGNGPAPPLA